MSGTTDPLSVSSSSWLTLLAASDAHCTNCYTEPGALAFNARVAITAAFFFFFSVTFFASWVILHKKYSVFPAMTLGVKADNCSRVNSTIHTAIIVPCLLLGLVTNTWDSETMMPLTSVAFLQATLCCTIAYFIMDFIVIVYYKVPMWIGFATHHAIAIIPFFIYMFFPQCPYGLFILSGFMMVEFSNFSLNTQAILQQNGHGKSRAYAFAFYWTFVSWIFIRIINPIAMLVILHVKIWPALPEESKMYLLPGITSAYLIVVFCSSVFVGVLCKELRNRWAAEPSPMDTADPEDTRAIKSPLNHRSTEGGWKADPARQMANAATTAVKHAAHMDDDEIITDRAPLVRRQ